MTLTFTLLSAMVMTYSHGKDQGERLVSSNSKDRVDKNGWTDRQTDRQTKAIAIPDSLMRSVKSANHLAAIKELVVARLFVSYNR